MFRSICPHPSLLRIHPRGAGRRHVPLLLAFLVGCGGSGVPVPDTAPVTGTVTYQGKPMPGAVVLFRKGEGDLKEGGTAMGETDASGAFTLRTFVGPKTEAEGAVPGTYKVAISKMVPPDGISEADYKAKVDEANKIAETGVILEPDQEPPARVELLPPKYSNLAETELSAEIKEGQENRVEFPLE